MGLFNNCKFTSTTAGVGSFGVGAALIGFRTPAASGVTDGRAISYTARSSDNTQWEYGHGTYYTAGPVIARTTVLGSSNANALVNFSAAPIVYLDVFAEDMISPDYPLSDSSPGLAGQTAFDGSGHLYVAYAQDKWAKFTGVISFTNVENFLLLRDGASFLLLRNGTSRLMLGH